MKKSLQIWTARVGYKAEQGEVALDCTAKSGWGLGKVFAPTWDLVNAVKAGRITWQQYTEGYHALLRKRYSGFRDVFQTACECERLVLMCYCADTSDGERRCHRYLLADVLIKIAGSLGIEARYMGEKGAKQAAPAGARLPGMEAAVDYH